ncbi:hypothetical protein R1flu_028742 [Riccia fluitans]|uniref:Protein kinase domain-containing protein n=1 Tax=Riccia fluitans TaxID=41844 RepID=A0ABD1XN33_9MARC
MPRRELRNLNSLSFKYKDCELISDNKIHWINFMSWVTTMLKHQCLGAGLYGTVFKVGVLEPTLASDLGSHDMVYYVVEKLHNTKWSFAKQEMLKELFAFIVSHPTVVRPVATFADPKNSGLLFSWWNGGDIRKWYILERTLRGKLSEDGALRLPSKDLEKYDVDYRLHASIFRRHRLKITATLLQGLAFIHGHEWLHCDIHFGNVLVHFPLWDRDDIQYHNKRHDNPENDGAQITHKLVFVGIGDLGYAQTVQDALQGVRRYNYKEENPRPWTTPKLTNKMAYTNSKGEKYVMNFTKSTNLFAMEWLIK